MIQVLVVEDNVHKQNNIRQLILDNSNIRESDVHVTSNVKDAKRLLYDNYYDLMILDLVLPLEDADDADAKHGAQFLDDIHSSPMLKPPIHIVGITGFSDKVSEYHHVFTKRLWNLIEYQAESTGWHDQLKAIIYHLVKTRQRFLQISLRKHQYDIAIITALPIPEFDAVLKLNAGKWETFKVENDFITYHKTVFTDGTKSRTIVAACADQMGMPAASHLATKMILYFMPKYLIMCGIAAGIEGRGLGFGDILIAEQSWDFGSGKIVEVPKEDPDVVVDTVFQPDTRDIQLNAELKDKINQFKLSKQHIIDKIQNDWAGNAPRTKLKLNSGPIGSGSYVISSEQVLKQIKEQQQRKLLGVEMETFGVYYAADHSPHPGTKAISIKSVSDYGNGQKNDEYQKYAAYTSASFAYYFIINEL